MRIWWRVVLEQGIQEWPLEFGIPSPGDSVSLPDGRELSVGRVVWFPMGEDPEDETPSILIVLDPS